VTFATKRDFAEALGGLEMAERSYEPITVDVLARLAELADAGRDQLFARIRRLGERYAERVLCVASHVACGVVPLQPSGAGLAS
jgi:hypothetical protein